MDNDKLKQAQEQASALEKLGKKELFYSVPVAGSSLSPQAMPIKGQNNQEVGVSGESLTYKAPSVTDSNARIGDYVLQGGAAKLVPNSPTDIVQKYVTSTAKSKDEIDWTKVAASAALGALGFPTDDTNIGTALGTAAIGQAAGKFPLTRVGWTILAGLNEFNNQASAILDAYYSQDFNYDLAGEFVDDGKGGVAFKPDYKKMAGAGPESGSAVLAAADTSKTGASIAADNFLDITVSPAFASSDEYANILKQIKENYGSLTVEQANQVVDEDTGKTRLQAIEDYISQAETNYLFDAQTVSLMKGVAPTASEKSLNTGTAVLKSSYLSDKMMQEATISIYDKDNNLVSMKANEYYDSINNMSKVDRQNYMESLGNRINSADISDDEKAVLYAQSRALYSVSQSEGAYKGMYQLDFWDDIGQKWFNDDTLSTFQDNGVFSGFISIVGTVGKGLAISKLTNVYEGALRKVSPKLSEWAGQQGAKKALEGEFESLGKEATSKDAAKALGKALAKSTTQIGYQVAADAVYDLGQLVPYAITDNLEHYNFLEMLGQDVMFDMLMTYGPRAFMSGVEMPKYEYKVLVEDTKTGDTSYKSIKDLKYEDNFKIVYDEFGMRDAELMEVTSEELAVRRARQLNKLSDSKIGLRIQELIGDYNAAMGKLAIQARGLGDTYLFRKLLNFAEIRVATTRTKNEFLDNEKVAKNWDSLKQSYKDTATGVRHRLSKEDVNYINASANEYRFLKRAEGDSDAQAKIRAFYKDAKEGVSDERKVELDALAENIRLVANDVLDFYVERGLMTQAQVDKLRALPEYEGMMYMPIYTKFGVKAGGEIGQNRKLMKAIKNGEALIKVDDLDNPLISISRYVDNAMRAVAVNDKALAIREAATMAGMGIHVVSDTGDGLRMVSNLTELDKGFQRIAADIRSKTRKSLPTQKQWQETNDNLVLNSKANKTAAKIQSLRDEGAALRKELRKARKEQKVAQELGNKKAITEATRKVFDLESKVEDNKQQQLFNTDEVKRLLKPLLKRAQKAHKGSDAELDIDSYMNVQATNALKKALKAENVTGEIQAVINRAVEAANPWVNPDDVISHRLENAAYEYRKHVQEKIKLKEPTSGDRVNAIVDQVMDKVTQKITGEKPTEVTFIDEEGMPTMLLDNHGQKNVIRYRLNGEVQEMKLEGKGAEELVREFYRPEYVAPTTTGGKVWARVRNIGNHIAQAKRYLTTSADITRVLPNIARDWSRGIVSTGGTILLSPAKMLNELVQTYGYDEKTVKRIKDGLLLTEESIDESTLNASLEMPLKNREKAMVRAMTDPDGNAFVKYTYDLAHLRVKDLAARPQDFGESLTRKRAMDTAYYKELSDSQAKGYSIDKSIKRATEAAYFAGREATVNFYRKGELIKNLSQQVPYLTQKFATLESFKYAYLNDPIAVTRSLQATVSTYTALIAIALATEESRQKYFLLTEYDRANNIIIPIDNGAIITIPLDDTIAAFLTPYRRMVETMRGVDPTSFFLCFAESLEALSPADLSGFSEGDGFNIVRGVEKLGSEFMPTWAQPIVEAWRGRSLYYGNEIAIDSDYTGAYYDNWTPSPGELTTKAKDSQTLAAISDNTGIPQWILQNFVSQYGGNISQYILNTIDKIAGATGERQGGKEWATSLFKPFTGSDSNQVDSAFYTAINQLKVDKSKVQKEIASITQKINGSAGEEKARLIEERQKKISDYGVHVTDVLDQYLSAYQLTGGLSKKQANQAWYLYMLYDQDQLQKDMKVENSTGDYYTDKESAWEKKQATNLAAQSGFDKLVRSPVNNYYDSYAESALKNSVYGDTTTYIANIEDILNKNEFSRYNMYNEYYNIIGSNPSSATKKKAKSAWNAKVVAALAPYVKEVGIDNLLANRKVVDYLDEVLFVDNPYKTKDYLKTIFGE